MPQMMSSIQAVASCKTARNGIEHLLLQQKPKCSVSSTRTFKSFVQFPPARTYSTALRLRYRDTQSAPLHTIHRHRGLPRSATRTVCLRPPPEYRIVSRLDRSKRTQSLWQDRWREERHRRSKEERSHKSTQGLFSWLIMLCIPGPQLAQWYRDYKQQQRQLEQANSWCERQRGWVQHHKLRHSLAEGL